MQEEWWESPVCYVCNYWWLFLILLALALAGWFTRDIWMPAPPPTPTATLTVTLLPTFTPQPSVTPVAPTATIQPTATRVETLGTGDVQVTLLWNSTNDLDLWVRDPNSEEIYYGHADSATGGVLDVDANPDCQSLTSQPVENIFWPQGEAPTGGYVISVNYFSQCGSLASTPFTVRVLVDGMVREFSGIVSAANEKVEIYRFER